MSASGELFENLAKEGEISPELRTELMSLATSLRSIAERIDVITKRKAVKATDAGGEPTFKFLAKVPIPKDFFLTNRMSQYALDRKFDAESIKRMFDMFVIYYNKHGVKWQDWTRVWYDWVRREENRRKSGPVTSDTLRKW